VADQALELIAAADGALVGLVIDSQSLRYVCGAGYLNDFVGEALLLQGSLSGQAIRSRQTLLTDDTELDQRVNRGATRAFDVRSSVCVPLGKTDGPIGVLNVSSRALQAFDEHDVALLSGLADFISTVIAAASEFMSITARLFNTPPSGGGGRQGDDTALAGRFVAGVLDPVGAARMESRGEIERVLSGGGFSIAVQPVFTFAGGEMFGVEALARFDGVNSPPPDVWLEKAHRAGLGVELELALVEAALEHLKELPPTAVLAVNAGPEALASERVAEVLAGVDASRIVVELTEHVKVEDYPHLAGEIGRLRATGVRLAIDDAGAGFASLMHILQLAPDFIKLDRALISGIDLDPVRRALLCSLLRFGEETGATLIAEGVETAAELMVLRDLGICHIQGFYLARPGPIADLPRTARRGSARVRRQARGPLRASERAGMRAAARA
jgi:EAL domain-containing protein (putative c-di-GMP-specific phosphodiesterase class I)